MLCPNAEFHPSTPVTVDALLRSCGKAAVFEPGQELFRQGELRSGIFIVSSGVVGLRQCDAAGNSALLSLCRPGDVLGTGSFLSGAATTVTAEVLTISRVVVIAHDRASDLCRQDLRVREYIMQCAITDLNRSQERCAALLTQGLKSRLVDALLSFQQSPAAETDGGDRLIHVPIQRKDLAALIGAAPESLSRLVGKLEAEGLLKFERRRVRLTRKLIAQSEPKADLRRTLAEQMLDCLLEARLALLAFIDTRDQSARTQLELKVESASAALDALVAQCSKPPAGRVDAFASIWEEFKQTRGKEIIPAVHAGKTIHARRFALGIQAERFNRMRGVLQNASLAAA